MRKLSGKPVTPLYLKSSMLEVKNSGCIKNNKWNAGRMICFLLTASQTAELDKCDCQK